MENQENINNFGNEVTNLIKKYAGKLPPYEVSFQLITQAVSLTLFCAPSELVAIKAILVAVECGIASYEEDGFKKE